MNASFVSEGFARRAVDIIWKLSFRGRPIYLLLLIEIQSTVDISMALRFSRQLADLYQSLVKQGQSAPLPARFEVFGRGEANYVAARTVMVAAKRHPFD